MTTQFVWIPKPLIKCSMCDSDYGHVYKIMDFDIWWEEEGYAPYVNYNFCSICFTVLNELWPDETQLTKKFPRRKLIESHYYVRTEYLHNMIKNNVTKYDNFVNHRNRYINKLKSCTYSEQKND